MGYSRTAGDPDDGQCQDVEVETERSMVHIIFVVLNLHGYEKPVRVVQQMSGNGRFPLPHRPELRHFENSVVFSDAVRPVQRRPLDANLTIKAIRIMGLTSFSDTVYYRTGIENYAHRGYH